MVKFAFEMQLETGALARWGTPTPSTTTTLQKPECNIGAIAPITEAQKALLAKCKKDGKYAADQSMWNRNKTEVVNGVDTSVDDKACAEVGRDTAAHGPTKGCIALKLSYKFPLSLEVEIYQEEFTVNGDTANIGAYRDLMHAHYGLFGWDILAQYP